MNADQWNARVPVVKVFDLCPECNVLKENVKERTYFYMYMQVKCTCCPECFVKRDDVSYEW